MGRPSKQKAIVDKFFVKNHQHAGKSDYRKCIFCNRSYAYNAFRLAKHLLTCTKTGAEFNCEKERIASLFKSPEFERSKRNSNSSCVAPLTPSGQDSFIPRFLRNGCSDDESELVGESQEFDVKPSVESNTNTNDSFTSTELRTADSSSASKTHFHYNHSNMSSTSVKFPLTTARSNYTSKHLSTRTLDSYVDCPINVREQEEIWTTLARACYASGTSLSFTENMYWGDVFKQILPSLELPTRYHLSSSLLEAEYQRVENMVWEKIYNAQFLSLQLGGWHNIRRESIVNVVLMTPEPVIYKIIDTNSNTRSGEYISNIIEDIYNTVDIKKIISVVTDAKTMTSSWRILKEKFRGENISYYGCAARMLNLVVKDIMRLETFSLLGIYAKKICVEFKQSNELRSLLKEFQNSVTDIHKKMLILKLANVTSWISYEQCLKSLISNKEYLQRVATTSQVTQYLSKTSLAKILDNDTFWLKIEKLVKILEPISKWIVTLESGTSNLSDVVCAFYEINEEIKKLFSVSKESIAEQQNVLSILENRKKLATEHIHLAAHLLDPRYKGKYLTKEESVDASQFIHSLSKHIKVNEVDVLSDLANYRTNNGLWSKHFVWECLNTQTDGSHMKPLTWWNGICSSTSLATVASAIIQCPPTSAPKKGMFSMHGLEHTAKTNQLPYDRAFKLIYVKHNLKLQESKDVDIIDNNSFNSFEDELVHHTSESDSDDSVTQAVNFKN